MTNILRKIFSTLVSTVLTILEIIVSLLLTVLLLPIAVVSCLVNEVVRLFVAGFIRVRCGSLLKLMPDGADCIWSYEKPGNGRTVVNITFYKEPLELQKYRELFLNRVINHKTPKGKKPYEKLKQIFTNKCGYFCWKEDENFNINNHVRYYPGTENIIVTESDLMDRILPDLFVDMDNTKPQWEEVIIPQFQYDNEDNKECAGEIKSARIFRYHHGYMDGASNLLMWATCMGDGSEFPYPVDPLAPSRHPKWKIFMYNLSCFLIGATTIVRSLYTAGNLKNRFVTSNFSGKRIFAWSKPIDVSILKEIKSTTKSSLPTIISAVMAGALRKLDESYVSSNPEFQQIPEEVMIGLVGALLPYPNANLRNRFTVVHFPVNTEAISRLQRLQLANNEMIKLSRSPISYLNFLLFKFFGRFPAFVIQHMMTNAGLPVIFSNVPMSTRKVKFWDNEVVGCAGWTPLLTNTGLGILTLRYSDQMRFCGVTDDACLTEKELKFFLSEVHNEVKLLAEDCAHVGRPHQIILDDGIMPKKLKAFDAT